ncbi:c-type cytochrome [Roseomonas sp. AR75]|uniref:c-type cytochrome n=1 Tax=Roseomonas sp. AR75 TaxID=2562311 RepID=UPI0010BFF913|nr:c-type cytochrome [Roseomonas sp. AR75]
MRFLLLLLLLITPAAQAQEAVHGGPVRVLAVSGGALASAGFDQSMIVWDPEAGRARAVVRWHAGAVNALAPLPGGGFASAGEDGRIALWPVRPGAQPERILEGHTEPVAALALSPDGRFLASAAWDGTARVWDLATGAARVLEGHQGNVNAVAFRPDGIVATAGFDGTVRTWPEGEPGLVLAEFGFPQNTLAALPDGTLAVGGVDGMLRLVAPDGGVREVRAGARPLVALAGTADGGLLAAASLGGSVTLWEPATLRLRHTLEGPGLPVWSAVFAPDGKSLWTGGTDRRVRRWDAATGRPIGPLGAEAEQAIPEGASPHGARVFRACAACHSLTAEGGNMAGPHLHNLFGRRMGSVAGYEYSDRLARGDIVWTRESVADLFTRGPDVVTPGTKMPIQRVGNEADLRALLDFLEVVTR